jgi:hypothetical protein
MGDETKPTNVVSMKVQARLIREAREARAQRKAGVNASVLDRLNGAPANDGSPALGCSGEADPNVTTAKYPGGIDDMEIG